MYAVILTGGKQYRVQEGQIIKIEMLNQTVDSTVEFDQVLLVANNDNMQVGQPYVAGATVSAKVIEQARHDKVRIIKFKRRKHQDKQMGHRQYYTAVKIEKISA